MKGNRSIGEKIVFVIVLVTSTGLFFTSKIWQEQKIDTRKKVFKARLQIPKIAMPICSLPPEAQ
jgi:hypothetical protein